MEARKADIIFGFLLIAASGVLWWESYRIAVRFAGRFTPFYYTPGFVPLLLTSTLIVLGVVLIVLRRDAFKSSWVPRGRVGDLLMARGIWAVVLIGAYVLLLPRLHFLVATTAFLFLSTMVFNRRRLFPALLVTVMTTFGVYFVFTKIFILSLP